MGELPVQRSADEDRVLEIACQEFVELVTEQLEGTLPADLERAIAAHLELCEPCVTYLEQLRATAAALRTTSTATLPPAARARLLAVFSALHGDADGRPGG